MIALSSAMFVYAYLRASCYSAVDRVPGFFLELPDGYFVM